MENFEKQFNQPKPPEETKNPEPKQEAPPVSESPRRPPENLNESSESPKENQEKVENQEKNLKLEEIRHEVENIGDRLGRPIDEGIRETVVMFKANELPTSDSCEGHVERGLPVPYVEVSAPNEPQERFVGQNESFEKAAKKYNITTEEAKTSKIDEAYWEAMKECSQNEETEEYKKWNKENEKLLVKGQDFLEEFYKERQVESDVKLQIEERVGNFRIHNGGEDYQPIIENEREFSEDEKKARAEKLEKYRPEMKEFTEFLKGKYFEENPSEHKSELKQEETLAQKSSQNLEMMRRLHEQQDKQKLQELREQLGVSEKKEDKNFFENLKRPYGIEDVKNLQQALAEFEEKRKKENGKYVFDYNNFYQFLTSFRKKETQGITPNEKEIPVKDYEELELGIFQGWRQNLLQNQEQVLQNRPKLAEVIKTLQNEPSPKNLDELRDLYRRYPLLNDMSAVSYQEGVGEKLEKRSGFLHINMARYNAYKYEMPEADTRIYLNPPVEAIPRLSMHLVGLAEKEKIPLYFKIIDYSFQKFTPENAGRLDKMLVYTDKENAPKLAKIIEELQVKRPQWFQDRELPNLVAPIGEGVGIAAEPSEFQKQKFGEQGKSFNSVRALFMREVWRDTTKDILIANKDVKPRGGRTFQQIFNDQLKSSLDYLKLDIGTVNRYIEQVWQAGLDTEKLSQEAKDKVGRNLESALLRTMQDVVPNITPDSLATWAGRRIQEKAPQYGINPENIALNK